MTTTPDTEEAVSYEDLLRIRRDATRAMQDADVQADAQAIVAGTQLAAWGAHELMRRDYDSRALDSIMTSINHACVNPDGSPVSFTLREMVDALQQVLPRVQAHLGKATALENAVQNMRLATDTAEGTADNAKT